MQTITQYFQNKKNKDKISIITCYDASFAKIISETEIDCILVGDSLGMVIQGYDSTIPVTLDQIIYHTQCVKRGAKNKFIIADLPFLSYQSSLETGILSAGKVFKETLADAVKIEGAGVKNIDLVKNLTEMGIPVMGHLGLTPQSYQILGGYKVQGKDELSANKIYEDAIQLQNAGVFSIVLEMIPMELGRRITEKVKVPTIGIGAGMYTDGQVLVLNDLLGMNKEFSPKFLKKYTNLHEVIKNSVSDYAKDVRLNLFPDIDNSF